MNSRNLVCSMCAGLFCTGLVWADDPVKANVSKPTIGAYKAPVVQQNAVSVSGPVAPRFQGNLANSSQNLQVAGKPVQIPAGVHVRPLGASRNCVNYIWDNVPNGKYYLGLNTTLPIDALVGVPAADRTLIRCYYYEVYVTEAPLDITTELAPVEGGPAYPGSTATTTVPAPGRWGVTVDLGSSIDISADLEKGYFIFRQTWSVGAGGPVLGEYAELGSNPPYDWIYWNGGHYSSDRPDWVSFSALGPEDTPLTGACCNSGYVCFENDDYYTCQYVHGGSWHLYVSCPYFDCNVPTQYDNCEDVVPVTIPRNSSYTWTGNNEGATSDCPLNGHSEVWFAFMLAERLGVRIDVCGSAIDFGAMTVAVVPDCPCSMFISANHFAWDCPDGNPHADFLALAAGTYYYPLYSVWPNTGDYVVTISTTTPPPAPPNDNCGDVSAFPLNIGDTVTLTGDTTGATRDCLGLTYPAEVWFAFTNTATEDVTITLCGTDPDFDKVGKVLVPDCTCSTSLSYGVESSRTCPDWNFEMTFFNVEPGTHYYPMYVDVHYAYGPYTINFFAAPPCGTCPPDHVDEAEVCGENYPSGTNGGCASNPPAFEPIVSGELLCGTVWADSGHRDTDWYELTTTTWQKFTWTVTGAGPMRVTVVDGTNGCGSSSTIGSDMAPACRPATVATMPLPPGTYWFSASLSTLGDYPCDVNYYWPAPQNLIQVL